MTATHYKVTAPAKALNREGFYVAVRNQLSRVANSIGLDRHEREELLDCGYGDLVLTHWNQLLADPEVHAGAIPEWVWNRYSRRATRACLKRWDSL